MVPFTMPLLQKLIICRLRANFKSIIYKLIFMKKGTIARAGLMVVLMAIASSCGNSGSKNVGLNAKKEALSKLENQRSDLDQKIASLQKEIAKLDSNYASDQKPKLVALTTIANQEFKHYIELQGNVDNKSISYITPSGQPGQVKSIYVKQGDHIHKGQLILKLDDAIATQNLAAARQQLSSVQAQLSLAQSVYERQKNLWDQNIGTEVQLLQDKTNVESLQGQLKTIEANIQIAETALNQTNVYSDVNGTVDDITTHVGETFNGNPVTGGYVRIVGNANLKVTVTVPENYAGKVSKGSTVEVNIPDIDTSFTGTISFLSESIGATNMGFTADIKIPAGLNVRPNQVAKVKILDYFVPSTVVINVNTLQTDEAGKFVLVAEKQGNDLIAKKRIVQIGQTYGDDVEIKDGLKPGDQLITAGYQSIYDGQPITTSDTGI
jgi:membrane fusion protein, multidrug efflux system